MVVEDLKDHSVQELERIMRELDGLIDAKKLEEASWYVKRGRVFSYRYNKVTGETHVDMPVQGWVKSAYSDAIKALGKEVGGSKQDYLCMADILEMIADTRRF